MSKTQITEHFTLEEFWHSDTAIARGIDNRPDAKTAKRLEDLAINLLQPLRTALDKPIRINSGFRNPRVNKLVGGVSNSSHLTGYAVDIISPNYENGDVYKFCLFVRDYLISNKIKFDQLIFEYGRWVHLGIKDEKGRQRGQVITINRKGTFNGITR